MPTVCTSPARRQSDIERRLFRMHRPRRTSSTATHTRVPQPNLAANRNQPPPPPPPPPSPDPLRRRECPRVHAQKRKKMRGASCGGCYIFLVERRQLSLLELLGIPGSHELHSLRVPLQAWLLCRQRSLQGAHSPRCGHLWQTNGGNLRNV